MLSYFCLRLRSAPLTVLVFALIVSCRTPATQIQLFIDTDTPADRAVTLEIISFSGSVQPRDLQTRANEETMGFVRLSRNQLQMGSFRAGGSVGILPPTIVLEGSTQASHGVTVWLRAAIASTPTSPEILLDRAARLSFVRGRSGTARVYLPIRCGDKSVGCRTVGAEQCTVSVWCREQNATCGDSGECVAPEVPVTFSELDGGIEDTGPIMGVDANNGRLDAAPLLVDASLDSFADSSRVDVLDAQDASDVVAIDADDVIDEVALDAPGDDVFDGATDSPSDVTPGCIPASLTRCGLQCLDTTRSSQNCGGCGVLCPGVANGNPACVASRCTVNCAVGFTIFGSRCLSNSIYPRQIAPVSLGETTLRRPTLRWQMPADFDSAIVDLCLDRDCATVIETLVVAGSSVRPSASLPAGTTVYWRLRGRTGALIAGTGSPTWLFHVPTRDATSGVDTSGLPHLDINGDGLDDVAVGSPGASPMGRMSAGEVSLFYGNQLGLAQVPAAVLVGESAGDQFGYSVSTAGDVNGDGFGDLLIASPNAAPMGMINAGRVSVYLGSAAGLTQMPLRVYNGLSPADLFGYSVSSAGDVNADGFGDIIVGATAGDPAGRLAAGTADIYYGSTTGSNPAPNRILEGVLAGDGFGVSVAGAGDVNGDGFGDLFVGAWSADIGPLANAGAVSTFHGSPTGIAAGAARVLTGPIANEYFGRYLAGAGDVNNDGFNDLLVGAYFADFMGRVDSGSASVFHGSVTGIESVASVVIGGATAGDYFGRSASGAGDVNGDGFDDIVVGAYFASPRGLNRAGTASVFLGGATGVDGVAARVLEGDAASDNLGISVASVGDLDGDKYSDIIVGSWGADPMGRANAGIASVFQGGIGGISMVPTVVLQGAAAGDNFGFCVANASEVSVSRRGLGWIIRRSARRARGRAEARLVPTTT